MGTSSTPRRRKRGTVQTLPSGSLRVRVYAGFDPVSKQRHYLMETVPSGPTAAAQAEKVRTRLLAEVDAGKQTRTAATVARLMERYVDMLHVEESTRDGYEGLIRNHIVPLLGDLPVGRVRGDVLDSFYAELRRCRIHCSRKSGLVDHRTRREVPPLARRPTIMAVGRVGVSDGSAGRSTPTSCGPERCGSTARPVRARRSASSVSSSVSTTRRCATGSARPRPTTASVTIARPAA